MKKRILSLLLALTMIVGMLPLAVFNVSAASTPITNLHRGSLSNNEDPRFLYWDASASVEKYEVKCYLNGSLVKTTLVDGTDNKELWVTMPKNYGYWADNLDVPSGNYKFELTAGYMYGDVFVPNSADSTATVTFSSSEQKYGPPTYSIDKEYEPGSEINIILWSENGGIFSFFEEMPNIYLIDSPDWLRLSNGVLKGTVPANAQEGTIEIKIGAPASNNIDGYIALYDIKIKGEETEVNWYEITEVWIQDKEVTPQYWDLWSKFQHMWYTKIVYLDLDGSVKTATGDAIYDFMSNMVPGFLYNAETGKVVGDNTVIQIGKYQYRYELNTISAVDLMLKPRVYLSRDAKVYVGNKLIETQTSGSAISLVYGLWAYNDVHYIYDEKPEINSVTVNGESLADGGAVTANGNVTIKTNYDGLSDALKDYGCSVKQLSAYYLNGEKINVAMINPVDNGDGTATKTYSRNLTAGDELRVESWLEVKWPDGSTDRVDEHTVTVTRPAVAFDFANQNPVGSADATTNLTANSGDTKTYTFGSTAVPSGYYVEKKITLRGLFAGLDADRTVTVKDGSATLTHTFIKPGLYQLTETLNLYENGSTKVIATKSHKFLIEVAAADPAFIVQPHYDGQGMQMGTNYVSWKLNFTPVKLIARCNIGTHARPNIKEYELDPTKSFAALVAYSQNYVLYAFYGEGARDYVASDAFSAQKPADFTPAFTKQPVGDQSLGGNPVEVTWATNFTPVKISIMQGSGVKPTMEHSVLDDATATSTLLGASENNYFICAYYSDTEYVTSNKFKITELAPAFTLQPADGVSLGGAYAETSWATNFTPVKLQLVKYDKGPTSRPFYAYEDLDVDATYCTVEPGHDYYCIRAYYSDTQYVLSEVFYVTEMNYYNAWFYVDDTVLDKVMVLEGDYVARPADPVKDGYRFLGWYTDDDELYNFAAPVTDDVHLTARYEQLTVISEVNITVTAPAVGATLNKSVACTTEGIDDAYLMTSWYDVATSTYLTDGATFEAGKQYGVDVSTVRAKDGYVLANDVVVKINGKTASKLMQGLYRIEFDALPGNSGSNITVNCIGDIDYTVSGNVVTVDHEVACKVGYLDGTAYKAITAVANGDGTYSFTAPAGVTEVLLVVKGDVNGDGTVNTGDSGRLNAVNLSKVTLTAEQEFAADANGDGTVNTGDSGRLNAVNLSKTTLTW